MGDNMKDKSKLTAIILVIITIVVVVVTAILNNKSNDDKDINIVTNYSNFYTVNSCLYRVITYVADKDTDSLMLILDSKYKKENNVTSDNVLNLFNSVNSQSTFVSKKMYYQTLSSNITKYYVYGYIEENVIYDENSLNKPNRVEAYFIVYLDSTNKTFSIEPYSGELFMGGDNNE